MKRIAAIILAALLACMSASAQVESVIFPFTEAAHDVISASMAGAVLLDGDSDIRASYQSWAPSASSFYSLNGSYTFNGKVTVKAGGSYGIADIEGLKPSEMFAGAALGYRFAESFGAEVGAKYVSSTLAPGYTLSGFCADALMKAWFGNARLGAGVTNLGPAVEGFNLPSALVLAAAYDRTVESNPDTHRIVVEADIKYYLYGEVGASAGLAYTYNNLVSVRAGFHAGGIVANHVSIGLGFKFKGVHIDGCYLAGLSNSFCVGLGYAF